MTDLLRTEFDIDDAFSDVVAAASDAGFALVEFETNHGQRVWEWRRGDEPRPQFVSRRVALFWMDDVLAGDCLRSSPRSWRDRRTRTVGDGHD